MIFFAILNKRTSAYMYSLSLGFVIEIMTSTKVLEIKQNFLRI